MQPTWRVRTGRGRLYDEFIRHGVAALGWSTAARFVAAAPSRRALPDGYAAAEPARRHSALVSGASQAWRFVHDVAEGDRAVTCSPQRRCCRVGRIAGPVRHRPDRDSLGMPLARRVDWQAREVPRDALPPGARNALGRC